MKSIKNKTIKNNFLNDKNDNHLTNRKNSNKNNNGNVVIFKSNTFNKKKYKFINDFILKKMEKQKRKLYFIEEELNALEYKYALEIDDRTFFQYYCSLLKKSI